MIRSVLIVGGGSSGWMTAAYLAEKRPDLSITLVESPHVPTLGVGESTNPISADFNRRLGLSEIEFMKACDATYKIAIRFENFSALGDSFYHPFGDAALGNPLFRPSADSYFITTHLSDANRFNPQVAARYGYQVDASLYGQWLGSYARDRGVSHRFATIDSVERDGSGDIVGVGEFQADLYIDCTGFRSLLLGGTLEEPFHSLRDFLYNDRAVAVSVPYLDREQELVPYTRCTALSAGWVWDIPLWSRRGMGYVFSSSFLSAEEAERELRDHVGRERASGLVFRHLRIRHGRHERCYVRNCVGIGPSAGFIEPLESTSLALSQQNIMDLSEMLDEPERFNARWRALFDTTADFVLAHYSPTRRDDTPYWRSIRESRPCTGGLQSVLSEAVSGSFAAIDGNPDAFYGPRNWNVILSGMGLFGQTASRPCDFEAGGYPSLHTYMRDHGWREHPARSVPVVERRVTPTSVGP